MATISKDLAAVHTRWAPVDERVAEIQANIRSSCENRLPGESDNRANERLVEEFIAWLREEFPGRTYEVERSRKSAVAGESAQRWDEARARQDDPCVVIGRQRLSRWALRTTRWNFVFTVPGESAEALLLVAHYDTWRGPGADDNTTGEEILKQYLLADLGAKRRPRLTHVYFLAGSEECGLVGLLSQLLLAGGLIAGMQAVQQANWVYALMALALCPFASYRFGVSGSREYVRALSTKELRRLSAVVAVDSVGEGRMFIPRSTLGADFIRAMIPFGDYDAFTDILEEAAHLHGIKYNNYLAGGTTDHLSFLEVNNGLWFRARDAVRRAYAWLRGRNYEPPRRIPASALVAMSPGKASPLVFGGKIHTPQDVPERVYAQPLGEALLILDYVFYILEGGTRLQAPREVDECHYARLYEVSSDAGKETEYWLALKDAVEPNRRNLNAVFRAEARIDEGKKTAVVRAGEPVGWGVDIHLREDVEEVCAKGGLKCRRVRLDRLEVEKDNRRLVFARSLTLVDHLRRRGLRALAWLERQMGRHSFLTFFVGALLLSELVTRILIFVFMWSYAFQEWFFRYQFITMPSVLILQIGLLVYLMVRRIPTWIDNNYRHSNRADNLGSLRWIGTEVAVGEQASAA
jgi:hypothetical protein